MYFLGIDGGGSHTRALLSDATGGICGQGSGGPTNPRAIPQPELRKHLLETIRQACGEVDPAHIRATHLGIAGAGDPSVHEKLSTLAREVLNGESCRITVGHDLETALEGGLAGAPGIVLVAGTGSACYGRDTAGQTAECGGWGDLVDDVGSGGWLGLRALQACVMQADGRLPESALKGEVMAFLGIDSMAAFNTRVHDTGLARQERAALAPILIDLAESGDATARRIVAEAAEGLCQMAASVRRQLKQSNPLILLSGGLTGHAYFRKALEAALQAHRFETIAIRPRLPAVAGAVLLALKSTDVAICEDTITHLADVPL